MPTDDVHAVLLLDKPAPHVLRVTLNRPEVRNAINGALANAMEGAVDQSEADESIRVVILAAAGDRTFCAGADLSVVQTDGGSQLATERGGFAGFVQAKRTKPWIAAVASPALGGGLELCLACDLIVATRAARFGLPEVKRGVFAGAGGVLRLPRVIPRAIALEMIATGDPIDAERALALGLINRLAEGSDVMPEALRLAEVIAANAPISVRESLMLARQAHEFTDEAFWPLNKAAGRRIAQSEDFREGPRAFFEKRAPTWTGR